ncbi:Pyridoxal phosphate-dependent transferase major region subdomain 2 [Penicillium sp. IBT 18751x]|nr:Pyridoxal phosphate-dependent transferase major region subdomain 2 [Penicillium sp. IBT 18751x]
MLSSRALKNIEQLGRPWRFAPTPDYDHEKNPKGLISFGLAENRPMRAEIIQFINEKVVFTLDSISYRSTPASNARLPSIAATHMSKALNSLTSISPEHVLIADCPTSLGSMLGFNLAAPGEGILVNRPVYGRFELDYGIEAGVEIVYADTDTDMAFTPDAVEKYEQALANAKERGVVIRAVLIVNPHNPVGRCYPIKTLKHIARFCDRHKLHLISDEVYASCVFESGDPDAVPFTSILSLDLKGFIDPDLVHVLYGFSKDFASGGLRLGFLVTQNEQLRLACKMSSRFHSPSQAAVTIGMAILEDQAFVESFTAKTREGLAARYKLTTSILDQAGIKYAKGGNAGFFIYVDLSPFLPDGHTTREQEFALAEKFVEAGVFLHPGEEHGKDAGWFRLVFSQEENALKEGLRRLTVECSEAPGLISK